MFQGFIFFSFFYFQCSHVESKAARLFNSYLNTIKTQGEYGWLATLSLSSAWWPVYSPLMRLAVCSSLRSVRNVPMSIHQWGLKGATAERSPDLQPVLCQP